MYTYSQKKQKGLFRNVEDYLKSKGVFDKSKYVKLANQINWEELCGPLEEAYCKNNGRPSIDVRRMLALEILKHMMKGISDEILVAKLQSDLEIQYFCGIVTIEQNTKMEPSSLTHFRNRLSVYPEILKRIQNMHLVETIKKLPKKVQRQYDQDSTVVQESIKFPHDIDILNDVIQKGAVLIKKCKGLGLKQFKNIVAKGKRMAKKLYLAYNFSRGKGKIGFEETKNKMIIFAKDIVKTLEKGFDKLKYTRHETNKKLAKRKQQIKEYLRLGKEIIKQQKELFKRKVEGQKQTVKNRIVSMSKPHIRPIMKGKKGKKVQFGAKVHIGQIGGKVAVFAGLSWENEHDSKQIKNGVEIVEQACGKPPSEIGYDKGGRSKDVYKYLEGKGIKNHIQGSPERRRLEKNKKKRLYNRRAFNEAIINDVLNHRGVNNNKYSKRNTIWNAMIGCMASNYIRVR